MLHDLLGAPLVVHDLEHFALLLREENEGAQRALRRVTSQVDHEAILAHVCSDVQHPVIVVKLVKVRRLVLCRGLLLVLCC